MKRNGSGTVVCVALLALGLSFPGCGDDVTSPGRFAQQAISDAVFSASIATFKVSVYYEEGAAPYDGPIGLSGSETWDITEESYQELFTGFPERTVAVPKTVSVMTMVADQGRTVWNTKDLIALGTGAHTSFQAQPQEVDLGVIFLNGTFEGSETTVGVHFTGYPFAFVFRDLVVNTGGTPSQQRYVEQAVVVHELGHAVGLVNNGVPMSAQHEDGSHPKHTINENGVMYWAIETTSGVSDFVTDVLGTSETQLFGSQSLADAQAYNPQ